MNESSISGDGRVQSPLLVEEEPPDMLLEAGRFPVLDSAQIDILRGYGSEEPISAGGMLFREGDDTYDLMVVLAGEVQIVVHRGKPSKERIIAGYGPGHFLGEIGMLTGQRVHAAGVAVADGRVLRVPVEQVRE